MFMTLKHRQRYAAFSVPFLAVFALAVMPVTVQAHPETAAHHEDPDHHHDHSDSKGGSNLGDAATNPVAPLMSMRLQYQNSPSNYNADGYSQAGIGQAVIPIPLDSKAVPMLITRTTIPYVSTPDLGEPVNRKHGFGDTSILAFALPNFGLPKGHTIAMGASIGVPTAGDNEFTGSGQWQLGPTVAYLNTKTKGLQWGMMVYQNWDVASTRSDAQDVDNVNFQPILNYHFGTGWYVGLPDLPQTYNNETNNWTTQLGGVLGRVFPYGKQHLQMYGGVYYNTEEDDEAIASEWTLKFNLSFLLPE
ncbi:MAG: hypothetical protein V7700_18740 [Halioglobus sp.]